MNKNYFIHLDVELVWQCSSRLRLRLLSQLAAVRSHIVQGTVMGLPLQATLKFKNTIDTRPVIRLPDLWSWEYHRYKTRRVGLLGCWAEKGSLAFRISSTLKQSLFFKNSGTVKYIISNKFQE